MGFRVPDWPIFCDKDCWDGLPFLDHDGFLASCLAWENRDGVEPRLFQLGENCTRWLLSELDPCPVTAAREWYFMPAQDIDNTLPVFLGKLSHYDGWLFPSSLMEKSCMLPRDYNLNCAVITI